MAKQEDIARSARRFLQLALDILRGELRHGDQTPVPEDGVLVIDRETVDDPFGERAILASGHRLVQHPFGVYLRW